MYQPNDVLDMIAESCSLVMLDGMSVIGQQGIYYIKMLF